MPSLGAIRGPSHSRVDIEAISGARASADYAIWPCVRSQPERRGLANVTTTVSGGSGRSPLGTKKTPAFVGLVLLVFGLPNFLGVGGPSTGPYSLEAPRELLPAAFSPTLVSMEMEGTIIYIFSLLYGGHDSGVDSNGGAPHPRAR